MELLFIGLYFVLRVTCRFKLPKSGHYVMGHSVY